MNKEIIRGYHGYDIPSVNNLTRHEKQVVIISHGFGSSKDSPTVQALLATLPERGIGALSFDFPAHGESPEDGESLSIENCTADIAAVEAHVRKRMPSAEILYFSSSFGAYINLLYLSAYPHAGRKSFLRCAAVDMRGIFASLTTPRHEALLQEQGYVLLDEGYVRSLKITRGFLEDLRTHNVFALYRPGTARLMMIHGTADKTAPLADARRFAALSGAAIIEVEGADHRFLIPGGMDRVIDAAVGFFISEQ